MAKDPAFLFYPGDWLGGTMGMTIEQKGAYMELLVFQFNNGPFSQAQAKQVLSICFTSVWQVVSKKFTLDPATSLYSNDRLSLEIEKRRKFSESRRNNASGVKAYAKHMENRNENEDVNEIENKLNSALDEIYLDNQKTKWTHVNFDFEVNSFKEKVRGSPMDYRSHDVGGIRKAFQYQLRNAKNKPHGKQLTSQITVEQRNSYFESKYGSERTS